MGVQVGKEERVASDRALRVCEHVCLTVQDCEHVTYYARKKNGFNYKIYHCTQCNGERFFDIFGNCGMTTMTFVDQ
jgi:hypothetical protein